MTSLGRAATARTIIGDVSLTASTDQQMNLARQRGLSLFSAGEAMLKGLLEAQTPVALMAGPKRGWWGGLFEALTDEAALGLLGAHGTRLVATPDASCGVMLALQAAAAGQRAFALVPNDELDLAMHALGRVAGESFGGGGAVGLVLADDPVTCPASCPQSAAVRLGLPCVAPGDIDQLRDWMEHVIRLARAGRGAAALVVHQSILHSSATLETRPNRIGETVEAGATPTARRGPRWAETGGVLRMARRLELNQAVSVPSPGERLPAGFITVGPAAATLDHLIHALALHGRVPVVKLGLVHPIDEPAVERLLGRCEQVVVLEPRPGATEASVLRVAEAMRRRGEYSGTVWSRTLGAGLSRTPVTFEADDAVIPSLLAAKIAHLLTAIRPGVDPAEMLSPDPPPLPAPPPPRGGDLGFEGARAIVRGVLADVDQWLRDQTGESGPAEATALAIDGVLPATATGTVVRVETWPRERFLREGIATLHHRAGEDHWILLLCALGPDEPQEMERLVRGAIPEGLIDRVRVAVADLNQLALLRQLLRELGLARTPSVVIVGDGPPARFHVGSLERSRREIDGLGYEPRQRVLRSAESACDIRQASRGAQPRAPILESDLLSVQTRMTISGPTSSLAGRLRFRIRPLLEHVEVIRDRPPASTWRNRSAARPALPTPIHASRAQWRVHFAGYRGDPPGVGAWVLCEAGRDMGYHVRTLCDLSPIGPGRRAWAQLLFTRPGRERALPLTARIPYGRADLLLGLDRAEALRAIDPAGSLRVANVDHTLAVINLGRLGDEPDAEAGGESGSDHGAVISALRAVSRGENRLLEEFSGACRIAFHTDRVVDLALLGAAYQRGLVPVSLEAIDTAVRKVEARGVGRAREAFQFGRHLAVDDRLFARLWDPQADDVDHSVRRARRLLRRRRWARREEVVRFARLLKQTVAQTPGLAETDPGRVAHRDLVIALDRCLAWGGLQFARRYAELISMLYRADRGDKGRAITRDAVLPLAEAMLIRDPIYIATMATSADQRLRTRRWLNVKPARHDRLERRYLTRFELVAFRRRFRLDVRTADWPAWIVAGARHLVPLRWRGSRRERRIRDDVIGVAVRAARGAPHDYQRWSEVMHRLHQQAVANRLRGMASSELRMLIEETEERS